MRTVENLAVTAASCLVGWAAIENSALLCVSRYEANLLDLPRIVQISDLHKRQFGKDQKQLIRKVAAQKPAYIAITGDLVSRDMMRFDGVEQLLKELCQIAPVLTVDGNHEADLPAGTYARYRDALERSGVIRMDNRICKFGKISFAGLSLPQEYYRGGGVFGFTGEKQCTVDIMRERLGDCPPNTVLLAHNPLWFPEYVQWGAALTLAGHVHGGVVRLPKVGGLLSPERQFCPKFDKGLYRRGQSEMIVSAGLGKLRLFNPPEICVISAVKQC